MRYIANPPNPWLTHSVEWVGQRELAIARNRLQHRFEPDRVRIIECGRVHQQFQLPRPPQVGLERNRETAGEHIVGCRDQPTVYDYLKVGMCYSWPHIIVQPGQTWSIRFRAGDALTLQAGEATSSPSRTIVLENRATGPGGVVPSRVPVDVKLEGTNIMFAYEGVK